ncbi:MAG: branched-chain amino acid ABC transporter permease [Desulfarculus sp.]|nr:branched-chain amino acid ABC transporter permease [Desulfarculus sp.]
MGELMVFFLHGLAYAGLLFLVSSGLTLVFGMMNVLNFAHASFYMLGAYFALAIAHYTNQFWLTLALAPLLLMVLGALVERFLLRKVHVLGHVHELLLTFGLAYIIQEGVKWIRIGIIVRAAVNDSAMVNALGINVPYVFMGVFSVGAGLSGLAGAAAGPLLGVFPGMAGSILVDAFVVIVVGGMGSLGGAVLASLLIGQLQSFGVLLFPKFSLALIYMLMALVLVLKPEGLFGEKS